MPEEMPKELTPELHPITAESFAIIDREIGPHHFSEAEYAIVRRAIHASADFELKELFTFSPTAITAGIEAIQHNLPIIVDVRAVAAGVASTLAQTQKPPAHCALDYPGVGPTRTAAGTIALAEKFPDGIYIIGNAPTALLALVERINMGKATPSLVVGAPVGFVAVEEAKAALATTDVPQIIVRGRKGGSAIAAAILNALALLSVTKDATKS